MGLRDILSKALFGPDLPYQSTLLAAEQKLRYIDDLGAAFVVPPTAIGPLVHGPGATELLTWPRGSDANSAVYACLQALSTAYIEAVPRVYRRTAPDSREEVPDHAAANLLARPNPSMSWAELGGWIQWAKHLDGNAYVRKVRATRGGVVELWPLSPFRVELRSTPERFIAVYRYYYSPGRYEDLRPEDIVHFRLGLDDRDHRRGLAPLRRLARLLTTDECAAQWTESLLSNGAVPGLVIESPHALTQEKADEAKAKASRFYGNGAQGSTAIVDHGAKMHSYGFSPEQMLLRDLHRIPEERISAVLRVPAIVAGLGAGLERSTYSNVREAREMFAEATLLPLWQMDAEKLTTQLLPEFTSDASLLVAFDLTPVRAFAEDENAKVERLARLTGAGLMTVNEARGMVGLDDVPNGDVLLTPQNVVPTPIQGERPIPLRALPDAASGAAPERKQVEDVDEGVSEDDLRAWRKRATLLGLNAFLDAEPLVANGNGAH